MKLLSRDQKMTLARFARTAWGHLGKPGLESARTETLAFDEWRRREVHTMTGCDGLSKAGDEHFDALKGHFLMLAGDDAGAMNAHVAGAARTKTRVAWSIGQSLKALGKNQSYADGVARRQFGKSMDDLTEEQARKLAITLSNNVRRARAKTAAMMPF